MLCEHQICEVKALASLAPYFQGMFVLLVALRLSIEDWTILQVILLWEGEVGYLLLATLI